MTGSDLLLSPDVSFLNTDDHILLISELIIATFPVGVRQGLPKG